MIVVVNMLGPSFSVASGTGVEEDPDGMELV